MKIFTPKVRSAAVLAAITSFSLSAQAQVEEDSSAAFSEANAAMEAALGIPSADVTETMHANGMVSADMGLQSMKMLVVRQNEDGSYSYGHASSETEAQEFVNTPSVDLQEEK